jgi:threonine/homoserine/homoserine lactone efflux protein
MTAATLLLIAGIHALALISPGPDFAVVTRLSIVAGRRAGLWAAAGVATAIGIYVLISVLGMALVLAAVPGLARVLAVVGAVYLAWLGVQCLHSRGQLPQAQGAPPGRRRFVTGLLTNLLNPKAMLYFGSVLSQAVKPGLATADIALLWTVLVAESFVWFALVATLFSSRAVLGWLRGRLVWLDRGVGAVLIVLAAKVSLLALG